MALTHIDADHTRGLLAVLDRYHVGAVLVGMADPAGVLYPQWQTTLKRRHLQPIQLFSGHHIALGGGVVLEVVNPAQSLLRGTASDRNNNGLVLRLVHGEVSFLLTGDIEAEAENYLARTQSGLESTVIKVAHHGSQTSTTSEFLQRVNPTVAVVSYGADNRFNHPNPEVVRRLEQAVGEDRLYQTAKHGTIELTTDGHNLWVKTAR